MDKLREKLQQLRRFVDQQGSTKSISFVPQNDLESLLTREVLETALKDAAFQLEPHQWEPIAREVLDGVRKIFAILVELKIEEKLRKCLEKNLTDSVLPFVNETTLAEMFPTTATNFQRLQWEYIPVKLRQRSHKDFDSRHILPFMENEKLSSSGGFSSVFKVRIHPQYQDWAPATKSDNIEVVRKEILSSVSYEAQRQESNLLFLLRSLNNPNIVQLITSYTQNSFCNLLFPVADCDLHDLLLNPDRPQWIQEPAQVTDSLRNLSNGLNYLHNFRLRSGDVEESEGVVRHGYHHDIKPKNILVFGSRLVLSDFGLSRMKGMDEDTKTVWKNTPPTYRAPEACDPETLQPRSIGRAFDIWSFGCVLSEILTYAIAGTSTLKDFRKARQIEGNFGTTNCFHINGDVSPNVLAWFTEMRHNHGSTPMISLFTVVEECLVGDPEQRLNSKRLLQQLDDLSLSHRLSNVLNEISSVGDSKAGLELATILPAKLTLEKNRLQAWGYAVGLQTLDGQKRPWLDQTSEMYDKIYQTLKDLHAKLTETNNQENWEVKQHGLLELLATSNDELVRKASRDVRFTIENVFQLLNVSREHGIQFSAALAENSTTSIVSSLQRFGIADQGDEITQRHETALRDAGRYMSLKLTSEQSLGSDRLAHMIDPSLLSDIPRSNKQHNPLSVKWLYQGYRESDKEMVLVEERSYANEWMTETDNGTFEAKGEEIFTRIQDLAKLLQMKPKPEHMRTLNCLGLYHLPQGHRFGFVYEFPKCRQDGAVLEPVTLSEYIHHTKEPDRHPTLDDKFALSQTLVRCIHSLHLAGWLHKCVGSPNVILFHERGQDIITAKLSEVYLAGFQYSRESKTGAFSEGAFPSTRSYAFTHPAYDIQLRGYHPTFDFYSLGVILLELALWRPVNRIVDTRMDLKQIRVALLNAATKYIPQRMGIGFCNIVVSCLNFYDKYPDEESSSWLLLMFQEEVLEPLCRTSLPSLIW